jgi:hypothetical protein
MFASFRILHTGGAGSHVAGSLGMPRHMKACASWLPRKRAIHVDEPVLNESADFVVPRVWILHHAISVVGRA